jgi:hypothetical protein
LAAAISADALFAEFTVNSMLLWPLQKKTSPNRTSRSAADAPTDGTAAVMTCGVADAASAGRATFHDPSDAAVPVTGAPPSTATVTEAPAGAPHPHTGMGAPRWRTIESPNTLAMWKPAAAPSAAGATANMRHAADAAAATARRAMPHVFWG